LRKDDSRSRRK